MHRAEPPLLQGGQLMKSRNRITRKIILRILIIETLIFIILIPVFYSFLIIPLRNNAITEADDTNTEIVHLIDNTLSSIKGYINIIASSADLKKELYNVTESPDSGQYSNKLGLELNHFVAINSNVRAISLQTNGHLYKSIGTTAEDYPKSFNSEWYAKIVSNQFISGFSPIYPVEISQLPLYTVAFSRSFFINTIPVTITIFYDMTELMKTLNTIAVNSFDHFVLLDENFIAFYASDSSDWSKEIGREAESHYTFTKMHYTHNQGHTFITNLAENNWIFASNVSKKTIFNLYSGYLYTLIAVFGLVYLLTVMIITPLVARLLYPIRTLSEQMQLISTGKLLAASPLETDDEIGDLSRIFCTMIENIKNYMNILIKKEKQEQQMKYCLLVSQIDPHFIYNTITLINSLAKQNKTKEIIIINMALIEILQDRLRLNEIEIFDTVEQEVNIVKKYISILNYRYTNQAKIHWDIDADLMETQIPKNMIQPLVENAFFHGLIDKHDGIIKGNLVIAINSEGEDIIIRVQDNGYGIAKNKLDALNTFDRKEKDRGKHIGLSNIRHRLAYITDNEECMQIISEKGKGTTVILRIKNTFNVS